MTEFSCKNHISYYIGCHLVTVVVVTNCVHVLNHTWIIAITESTQ